jgi:hypothetical protein
MLKTGRTSKQIEKCPSVGIKIVVSASTADVQ